MPLQRPDGGDRPAPVAQGGRLGGAAAADERRCRHRVGDGGQGSPVVHGGGRAGAPARLRGGDGVESRLSPAVAEVAGA